MFHWCLIKVLLYTDVLILSNLNMNTVSHTQYYWSFKGQ